MLPPPIIQKSRIFAKNTAQITNARMAFDRETLKPLYKMQIGEAGESCALYIAQRLGFPGAHAPKEHIRRPIPEGRITTDADYEDGLSVSPRLE